MKPEFENVYIYVSDSLRYDYIPDSVREEGSSNVIPTLIPAGYSPISFASLATGLDPRNHSVRSFYDTLNKETCFDHFENQCFYDHPDDALVKNIFQRYESHTELEDVEPPFFYIERAMDTHQPYGQLKHGNEVPENFENKGSLEERYRRGVDSTEEHFWSHVEQLKDRNLYEDTLIIFTSDHGEMLGEKYLGIKWRGHNKPIRSELCVVPTVFLNYDLEAERMRSIDIIPTALELAGEEKIGDGVNVENETVEKGFTMLQIQTKPLLTTGCNWVWDQKWQRGKGKIITDVATLLLRHLEPIRQKLRHTFIADILGSNVEEQRKFVSDEEEGNIVEDLDI